MIKDMDNFIELKEEQAETDRQYGFIALAKELLQKRMEELGRSLTYCLTTFGCQMNEKQSESVAGIMDEIGYIRQESENADVVIYNTCTVRENANLKGYGHLGHLNNLKKQNPDIQLNAQFPEEIWN